MFSSILPEKCQSMMEPLGEVSAIVLGYLLGREGMQRPKRVPGRGRAIQTHCGTNHTNVWLPWRSQLKVNPGPDHEAPLRPW